MVWEGWNLKEKRRPFMEAKSEEKFMILGVGERARLGRKAFVVMNGPFFCFDVRSNLDRIQSIRINGKISLPLR